MERSREAHQRVEYHLRQAFLTAESETTKFHVRKAASLLDGLDELDVRVE